jgi:hypothetical protein
MILAGSAADNSTLLISIKGAGHEDWEKTNVNKLRCRNKAMRLYVNDD